MLGEVSVQTREAASLTVQLILYSARKDGSAATSEILLRCRLRHVHLVTAFNRKPHEPRQ